MNRVGVWRAAAGLLMLLFCGSQALAQTKGPFALSPADPQPSASTLRPGLAVKYAYGDVRWLDEAASWRNHAKPGPPIEGFIYGDTEPGEKALTSDTETEVIAFIDGFMHFKQGSHELEFQSNDGLRVFLSGMKVYEHDGRHTCQTNGAFLIEAPKTGWYPVEVLYFQRKGTACLDLSMRSKGGDWDWTEPEMYAHIPQ